MRTGALWAAWLALAPWGGARTAGGDGDGAVDAARRLEERRIATIERVSPAVCAVMAMRSPGGGSGVVIDPGGHLLTNFHVVGNARRELMKVGLPDGHLYAADVLGIDPGGDVALLRLRPREPGQVFPHVELGDSDALRVGDVTFAMGNPFLLATDFQPTVTMGVVSGLNRFQPGAGGGRMLVYPDCIQVDTPINPGNSGGPLFNQRGELVGINGRISVRDRGRVNVGVGFAISINQIRNFLPDLRAGRHCEHGTLDANAWLMTDPHLGGRKGVFVQGMLEDSVAARAGIRILDEILALNGRPIRTANELARRIGVLPAGFEVTVTYRTFNHALQRYEEPRDARIMLAALDTGTARADKQRLAPEPMRAWERGRILERYREARPASAAWEGMELRVLRRDLSTGRSEPVRYVRLGQALLVEEEGERRLLREGKAFRVGHDGLEELDASWRVHLERLRDLHPLLGARDLEETLAEALLEGGHLVEGRAASVLGLPGEGRRAAFFDEATGLPLGCRFRSPVLGDVVELRLALAEGREAAGEVLHVVVRIGREDRFVETLSAPPSRAAPEMMEVGR